MSGTTGQQPDSDLPPEAWLRGLARVLRPYGYLGVDAQSGGIVPSSFRIENTDLAASAAVDRADVVFYASVDGPQIANLDAQSEQGHQLLYWSGKKWFRRPPAFHALLPFVSFRPNQHLDPVIVTQSGDIVVGWLLRGNQRRLICGFDPVSQFARYTHGDPARAGFSGQKNLWSAAGHEQPAYLYANHVVSGHEAAPWVDMLGSWLTETLSRMANIPALHPLPGGAKGAVLLTGDDDQAELAKYRHQQKVLNGFPISYFMMDSTNHTPETIQELSPNTEFGLHVDSLERPGDYDKACAEQFTAVKVLLGDRDVRSIRNHGHLNRGYWGHISAWDENGLKFDLNIRGLDGTCPTGSFLPFSVAPDGTGWAERFSLFSTFSDSMKFYQELSERQQIRLIRRFVRQIEKVGPGVLVFNFHPQNVADGEAVHRAIVAIGARKGWRPLGVTSYLRWLEGYWAARLIFDEGGFKLSGSVAVKELGLCHFSSGEIQMCDIHP
ncbi:hypothetical protein [Pyruvatibacter sp.]|uniref:hypothetical protein n=1 Tax=Pyruvatibacter sp. TaxID=1981328 RepID=UPI0032EE8523